MTESAIDLSVKSRSSSASDTESKTDNNISIVRPIPRPPWTIIWYQNLWPLYGNASSTSTSSPSLLQQQNLPPKPNKEGNYNYPEESNNKYYSRESDQTNELLSKQFAWRNHEACAIGEFSCNLQTKPECDSFSFKRSQDCQLVHIHEENDIGIENCGQEYTTTTNTQTTTTSESDGNQVATVIDIASCDGPVRFERVSNPNFALTVQHQDEPSSSTATVSLLSEEHNDPTSRNLTLNKTYKCIYCNQGFKSLFCYQKHKKRHLNPVSVDITGTNVNTTSAMVCTYNCTTESRAKTKDLNVQFFPCKKCGCKFPSYYFVHKHKKTCH